MNRNEKLLDFDKIIEELKSLCNTAQGKQQMQGLSPFLNESELRRALRETTQARRMLDTIGTPPIPVMEHVEENLTKAAKGDMLLPEELEEIGLFLTAVKRMNDYLERGKIHELSIAYYNENLVNLPQLKEEIARTVRNGRVDDYASGYLKDIRKELLFLENKIQEKAESVIRNNKSCMADSFVVKRNGCICVPVKKEYKSRIPGSVVDKSSTGATLFIEPKQVSELREEVDFKKIEEDCEERRILYTLSAMIAEQEEIFRENLRVIVRLDTMFAKGKLSVNMNGTEPLLNTEGYLKLQEARHPQLSADSCVPLNLELGRGTSGMIITGPNTGGKTVSMKTAGLFCLMACCGLHLPCREAQIPMRNQILCDIGDGQSVSDNLSTFSAHITVCLDILRRVTSESLVILDELGSGTDPAEGMGIAIAVLEQLRKSGCLFLVTTHYPEVKSYAARHEEIVSARMAFDKENLRPMYRLEMGRDGESCALYIAKRLGMPDELIAMAAKEAYPGREDRVVRELHLEPGRGAIKPAFAPHIEKLAKAKANPDAVCSLKRGDSVAVQPDRQIGIVVRPADREGNVLVQVRKEKILINHKRLKLKVSASELYPEDYDFSIIFDTVENRKARHQLGKRHVEGLSVEDSSFSSIR